MSLPNRAQAAYAARKVEAALLLEQLAAVLDVPEPADLNWSHVGSMTEVAGRLTDLLVLVNGGEPSR